METTLWRADPTARVVAFLSADPTMALFGASVGAENTPPYPAVVVSDPPGGNTGRGLRLISTVLQVEVIGDPDRRIERAVLKMVAFTTVDVLRSLPEQPHDPLWPTITDVSFTTPGWSPLPTRQGRYLYRATVHSHE